ncbi:MAG: DUF2203 family protein, partial [Gemmatimonadota bacterium]|nr:DUF2203 family protein [Gemmatimonadota bacterium]
METRPDPRIFSIPEANRALGFLRAALPRIHGMLESIEGVETRLSVLGLICGRSVMPGNPDLGEYMDTRTRYHRNIDCLDRLVSGLEGRGYLLRDVADGVVHFCALRGKQPVLLCWCQKESEV